MYKQFKNLLQKKLLENKHYKHDHYRIEDQCLNKKRLKTQNLFGDTVIISKLNRMLPQCCSIERKKVKSAIWLELFQCVGTVASECLSSFATHSKESISSLVSGIDDIDVDDVDRAQESSSVDIETRCNFNDLSDSPVSSVQTEDSSINLRDSRILHMLSRLDPGSKLATVLLWIGRDILMLPFLRIGIVPIIVHSYSKNTITTESKINVWTRRG
jgi:hypothetical protein